ncbi:hypothetical protein CHU93_14250 [Sandarakinorhabdus cyanobacteriorum]|uniref:Right handed beta helix domain-containing protein n=1 Tax=Sandarakinorhabdus cyanobacteriorum TaxID=1981098 RepID=A0A255Y709_9SPHN|nr:hypothetical protein CHU93_14250 [Sandarakinorhabdus cyanobacteriorum]
MPIVTCAALALALASPATSGNFTLTEDCVAGRSASGEAQPALLVSARFAEPVVVEATGRRVEGLVVENAGNFTWIGGQIVAPGGRPGRDAAGRQYYAVLVAGSDMVTLDGVHVTDARKAVAVRQSSGVTLRNSRCDGLVEDCMIVANSQLIRFLDNQIGPFSRYLPLCDRAGVTSEGVGRKLCEANAGRWTDGWHSDALQLRNGVMDVLASGNRINSTGQGLTQMDAPGDRPLANVRFENNVIASGRNGITLTECDGCRISGNRLTSSVPGWKSVVRPGKAMACGNDVPDGGPGRDKCPV